MKLIIFFVTGMFALLQQTKPENDYIEKTLVKVGDKAPDFTCQTLSGENFTLSEQKGKVVMVTFFATWCSFCMAELPQLEEKVYNIFKNREDFKTIVIGRKHDTPELEKFLEKKKFKLPFAPDANGEIYGIYAEKYIPRVFIVGKDGYIKLVSTRSPEGRVEGIYQLIKDELEKNE
jgi:peroxiredoxin